MSDDAVFLFTFSPIQDFIIEARRTSDLRTSSGILVQLSQAVINYINQQGGELIFPAPGVKDSPNKIAAIVPWDNIDDFAAGAENAFFAKWEKISDTAKDFLLSKSTSSGGPFLSIWKRQVGNRVSDNCWHNPFWEIYWSAARMPNPTAYHVAYMNAEKALNARKRCRNFASSHEEGILDTLSGKRSALQNDQGDARKYWEDLRQEVDPPDLRRGERLDAIGSVKRFSTDARRIKFPSTSSIASRNFLEKVCDQQDFDDFRTEIDRMGIFQVDSRDPKWPYDGDLFYIDALTPSYFQQTYPSAQYGNLPKARLQLLRLYEIAKPSLYYAILAMDGDGMGERVSRCLEQADPQLAHSQFSSDLATFSGKADGIVSNLLGHVVYSGGDDILALLPLTSAFAAYKELAETFFQETKGGTASAGIAIVHHTFPLGSALKAARLAEQSAKHVPNKDAVCFRIVKRSGETVEIVSPRSKAVQNFEKMRDYYQITVSGSDALLSSKFGYDVLASSLVLSNVDPKFQAELKRLIKRHKDSQLPNPDPNTLAKELFAWAQTLPGGTQELARWLIFARFVAFGGGEE